MVTIPNGKSQPHDPPLRRLRFDPTEAEVGVEGHSGRRLVIVALVTVLIIWVMLYLVFRGARTRALARATFGAQVVAPVVDPLAEQVPDGVSPAAWRDAVARTHDMLVALTAANVLDRPQMEQLRAELTARVAAARPETARAVLRSIWDDLQARAGPVLARHRRPL